MSLFRINTNVSALNAQRQLQKGNNQLAEAQERLSSGLRINSAADDAAGLAISQKTTGQIRGLQQASTNAQDGISMLQTAEGGLEETQSSLQRIRELSVQSANDTLTQEDRQQIQREVNQLSKEIQRISDQTEFNTKSLLDGTLTDQQLQVGANENQTIEFSVDDMGTEGNALDIVGSAEFQDAQDSLVGVKDSNGDVKVREFADIKEGNLKGTEFAGDFKVGSGGSLLDNNGDDTGLSASGAVVQNSGGTTIASFGSDATITSGNTVTLGGPEVTTADNAESAITQANEAINEVSTQRSQLGALQNRLETTISVDDITSENLQAARSRIRDADVAQESVKQTRGNILVQAGTSVLAQANQNPQSALQLLGG